eukprot:COSAG01_NODE_3546_length_5949_cov_2.806700_2_plen_219_part_00
MRHRTVDARISQILSRPRCLTFPNLKPEILVQTDVSLTLTLACFESGLAAGKLSRRVQILIQPESGPSQSRPVHACDRIRRRVTAREIYASPRPGPPAVGQDASQDGQAGAIKGKARAGGKWHACPRRGRSACGAGRSCRIEGQAGRRVLVLQERYWCYTVIGNQLSPGIEPGDLCLQSDSESFALAGGRARTVSATGIHRRGLARQLRLTTGACKAM